MVKFSSSVNKQGSKQGKPSTRHGKTKQNINNKLKINRIPKITSASVKSARNKNFNIASYKQRLKSKPKTLKNSKLNNSNIAKSKPTNIGEEEEQIVLIENQNKLFQDDMYRINKEDELIREDDNDWNLNLNNNNNNNNNNNDVNLNDLINQQMNQVNESKLAPEAIAGFKEVGSLLKTYTSGKIPKLFSVLPSLEDWEDYIVYTQPLTWSHQAMFEATKMFCSNLNNTLSEKFYKDYLLPNIRNSIKREKKLNIHLYNSLKKALFKPAGFFKGIIFPLAENLTIKEANIIGSILKKCSIPVNHSSSAIMKLIELNIGLNRVSHGHLLFIKLLLSKKYALPSPVKSALVEYFCVFGNGISINYYNNDKFFLNKDLTLPVIWHQTVLVFVQTYKFDLSEEEKNRLRLLSNKYSHHIITESVMKELNFKVGEFNLNIGNLNKLQQDNNK